MHDVTWPHRLSGNELLDAFPSAAISWTIWQKINAAAGGKFVASPCLRFKIGQTPSP